MFCDNKYASGAYGVVSSILEYMGEDVNTTFITCPIEHGLTITNRFVTAFEHLNNSNYIITNSQYNEDKINNVSEKKVIKIGPYIAYANGVLARDMINETKERNGRTLLIMPTHSIKGYENQYDIDAFLHEINMVKKSFDTVMVCMYYYDILCKRHIPYKNAGYQIVSAGNSSTFFLSKLRSILDLSDAVMCNNYTTGLQYAIYLDKPVYVFESELVWKNTSFNNVDKFDSGMRCMENMKVFFDLCNDRNFGKLEEQKKWGEYMFGIKQVLSKEEMKSTLKPVIRRIVSDR